MPELAHYGQQTEQKVTPFRSVGFIGDDADLCRETALLHFRLDEDRLLVKDGTLWYWGDDDGLWFRMIDFVNGWLARETSR